VWRLISVLTLCGMRALCADSCDGLPTDPPKGSDLFGSSEPLSFELSIRPGGPAFRITVRPLWRVNAGHVIIDDTHAGEVEVARCQDGKALQVFPIRADQPIHFGASFHAEDINFDGYLDFSVVTEFAAKWGSRSYWVYDPVSGLFVENELTRELNENCLGAEWHGGCWKAASIDFDQIKREVRANYIPPFRPCPPNGYSGDRYSVQDNRLILVHKEELSPDNCQLTYSDLSGGSMRVTRVVRFDGAAPVPEAPLAPAPAPQPPNSRALVSSVAGEVLFEHPLDDHQEGLFSNAQERHQVGAGQFVLSDRVFITGIRWYGYYTCNPVRASPAFDVRFYPDEDGLPASQPIYSAGVEAHVTKTAAMILPVPASGVDYQVYAYTVDLPGPLTVPAGQQMWISISAEASSCEWLWDRGSSADTGISASGISGSSGFSKWTKLKDNLAFALYGRKFGAPY
jgi:hypothetical protein